jgi:hypothetical protein
LGKHIKDEEFMGGWHPSYIKPLLNNIHSLHLPL